MQAAKRSVTTIRQLSVLAGTLLLTSTVTAQVPATRPTVGLQENVPSTYVLRDAKVVISPGRVLDSASVVVVDGVIDAVAVDPVELPGARALDYTGKTIYAGFIDAYSEVDINSDDTGARHWNSGVHPELRVADAYVPERRTNKAYRKNGFVARLLAPKQGQVKGLSALVSTADGDATDRLLREEVALHATLTVARRGRDGFPGSPMGALTLFRQTFYDVQWYRDAWRAFRANPGLPQPETNTALARLMELADQQLPLIINASNERYFLRADRIGREFGLPVIVRGSGREYRRLAEVLDTRRAIILPLDFPKAPDLSTPAAARRATLQQLMHWDHAAENPVALIEGGAKVAFTTDGLEKAGDLMPAVRKAIERGLSPDDALRALTVTPAQLFGIDDRLGTVEAGKAASFIVTDGDLFAKKTKIMETWVDGEQSIHQPDIIDVRGDWQIELAGDGQPASWQVVVKGTKRRLKGSIKTEDKPIKLRAVTFTGSQLSLDFPAQHWQRDGVARVTLVIDQQKLLGHAFLGSGIWPAGETFRCSATWTAAPQDNNEEDDEAEDGREADSESGGETVADESAVLGEVDAPKQDPPEDAEPENVASPMKSEEVDQTEEPAADDTDDEDRRGRKDEGDNEQHDDEGEDEDDDKHDEDKDLTPPADPLFPVNYPLGGYGLELPPEQPEVVVFQGATVWTCGEQGKLENATVFVRSGRIEAVGTDVQIPEGAMVIDASGKHISPGIIDCHSHIATDGGVNESTQAVTAEVRIGDFVDPDDISIYRQLGGGTTAANVLHGSSNPIGGQNQVIKMRWGVAPEALKFNRAPPGVKFALGENVKQSNWGEDHTSRYPQTRMGVDEIIADAFERALAYRHRHDQWKAQRRGLPPRFDLELEAISEVLQGQRWIHCHSYRQSELLALMKTCDRYGIKIGTFQHILEGYKVADEMARRGIMGSAFADWWAYKFEVYDAIPYAGALMHNAGVVVSFNSDDAELGRHLNIDAAKAMKYGDVPDEEALKFVTLNPARQLRIDKWVGSLEPGKDADLVVWSHPPLSIYAACEQTWVDGRMYFSRDHEMELRQRDARRHAALVQRVLESDAPQRRPDEDENSRDELWPREDIFCHGHGGHDHE